MDYRSHRPGPPAIEQNEEERARLDLVSGMAVEVARRYGRQGPIALTGGGALHLG